MTGAVVTGALTDDLPGYPESGADPLRPEPRYERLRQRGPVSRARLANGRPVWLVSGHEQVRQLLVDPRVSADDTNPGFPADPMPPGLQEEAERYASLSSMDPPEHTVRRRMVLPDLTVRRMQAMRPIVRQIVDEHLDAMLAGDRPVDLMSALTMPVSFRAACALLGVPDEERSLFEENSKIMIASRTLEEVVAATRQYLGYLDRMVAAKEEEPTDDLIGRFILRNREAGALDHDDVVAMARLLLGNGPTSAVHVMSYGTVALLEHPDQLAALRADPDLVPAAVEEVLRYVSYLSGQQALRVAADDIEISGVTIRAGDAIIVLIGAANGDLDVFDDPATFDIRRGRRNHLTFGHGVHQCVAQNLGRIELETVFGTLFTRIPDLRLAVPAAELPFTGAPPFSLTRLPVTW